MTVILGSETLSRSTQCPYSVRLVDDQDLLDRWNAVWPDCQPIADWIRGSYPERWVRFHSLPGSKRYAETDDERRTLLSRYNTVLDELFSGQHVYVISPDWDDRPQPVSRSAEHDGWHPGARLWTSICIDSEPGYELFWHLYVSEVRWNTGLLDPLLRAVADDQTAGVMIADSSLRKIHHPYDGGADVLLVDLVERDAMRDRHRAWLSSHPSGL